MFETRLPGQRTICLTIREAGTLFYDASNAARRRDAVDRQVLPPDPRVTDAGQIQLQGEG